MFLTDEFFFSLAKTFDIRFPDVFLVRFLQKKFFWGKNLLFLCFLLLFLLLLFFSNLVRYSQPSVFNIES
jgi:hypothetical protein